MCCGWPKHVQATGAGCGMRETASPFATVISCGEVIASNRRQLHPHPHLPSTYSHINICCRYMPPPWSTKEFGAGNFYLNVCVLGGCADARREVVFVELGSRVGNSPLLPLTLFVWLSNANCGTVHWFLGRWVGIFLLVLWAFEWWHFNLPDREKTNFAALNQCRMWQMPHNHNNNNKSETNIETEAKMGVPT